MKKTGGQKSRDTLPLTNHFFKNLILFHYCDIEMKFLFLFFEGRDFIYFLVIAVPVMNSTEFVGIFVIFKIVKIKYVLHFLRRFSGAFA